MPSKTSWFSTWTEGRTFSSPSLETTCPAALELHWKLCVAWRSPLERFPSPNSSIWLVKKSWAQTSDYAFNPIWTKTETVCFRISSRIFRALSDMRKDIIKNGKNKSSLHHLSLYSVIVYWSDDIVELLPSSMMSLFYFTSMLFFTSTKLSTFKLTPTFISQSINELFFL